ncbi:MAG: AAA family ATPase, partial [Rhodoferax sp.]|nr:AAA family ATPase [Rhodoferax sp.]
MSLHPILLEKLNAALLPLAPVSLTLRDTQLPKLAGKVHAVIGMRRAGKTTFLQQLLAQQRQLLPPERSLYLSFDDDRLAGLDAQQLSLLLEEYYRRYPELRGRETVHWFLDEIQLIPGWERFVRRVLDSEKVQIVVSGSSARMLSREVHTSLRGRGSKPSSAPSVSANFCAIVVRNRSRKAHVGPAAPARASRSVLASTCARVAFPRCKAWHRPCALNCCRAMSIRCC